MQWTPLVLTGLLSLTLSGCTKPNVWSKPGLTQEQWARDRYDCERDARMSVLSFGGGLVGAIEAQRFQGRCLESKGYARIAQ